jgi:hypothetical protein
MRGNVPKMAKGIFKTARSVAVKLILHGVNKLRSCGHGLRQALSR